MEATVLVSAEFGGYMHTYNVQCPKKTMISDKVIDSEADVNVIL